MEKTRLRLGVNIDHVATIRNARGGCHPDPTRAALIAVAAGADSITTHLRQDRRHILDEDLKRLTKELTCPLNLEMAPIPEMLEIALHHRPYAVCLVPERREEITTEGGLDVTKRQTELDKIIQALIQAGIRVSLFIDPETKQLTAAQSFGVQVVELHTGAYAEAGFRSDSVQQTIELERLRDTAYQTAELGLECHAGHGLTFENVIPISALPEICELNIGHFLIGEAIFDGLTETIKHMRTLMDNKTKITN